MGDMFSAHAIDDVVVLGVSFTTDEPTEERLGVTTRSVPGFQYWSMWIGDKFSAHAIDEAAVSGVL